jgi:hypothetical protein
VEGWIQNRGRGRRHPSAGRPQSRRCPKGCEKRLLSIGPTIIDHVTEDMSCGREEIFGPVLCVKRVENFEEGITLMNNSPFANGSVIYTQNGYLRPPVRLPHPRGHGGHERGHPGAAWASSDSPATSNRSSAICMSWARTDSLSSPRASASPRPGLPKARTNYRPARWIPGTAPLPRCRTKSNSSQGREPGLGRTGPRRWRANKPAFFRLNSIVKTS